MAKKLFGNWLKKKHIGQGGAGHTSTCYNNSDINKKQYVIKFLSEEKNGKLKRFDNEIDTLLRIKHAGVVTCIDSYNKTTYQPEEKRWYVMDKGIAISTVLEHNIKINKGFYDSDFLRQIFKNSLFLFKTLKHLHSNNIYHRDIKPENLVYLKNRAVFIDFGIAHDSLHTSNITQEYDKNGLGPKFFISPEMKRNPLLANYAKADIYSLTKTLWSCLTGQFLSFDGEYSKLSCNFLNYERCDNLKKINANYLDILQNFFTRNTSNDLENIMDINECIKNLEEFIFYISRYGKNSYLNSLDYECSFLFKNWINIDLIKINNISFSFESLPKELLKLVNLINYKEHGWFNNSDKLGNFEFFENYLTTDLNLNETYTAIELHFFDSTIHFKISTKNTTHILNTGIY